MMENEANTQNPLPRSIRRLFEDRDLLLDDDTAFNDYLIEAVRCRAMKPTYALHLYAIRHNMDKIELANVKLTDVNPKPAALEFFDLMLNGGDISSLLRTLDSDRDQDREDS
jgi:hypothetical protein